MARPVNSATGPTFLERRSVARLALAIIAFGSLMLPGLSPAGDTRRTRSFHAEDVSEMAFGRRLDLADPSGKNRHLDEFRGKVVLVYFGFTHCPNVCPTELARLAELRRRLGPAGERVQVLFVTLDPERDSAVLLREYVSAFDPGFIALRGTPDSTAETAKEFRVAYLKIPGSAPNRYTLDHSAYVYALDPVSRLRLRFDSAISIEKMLADVMMLIEGR